MQFNLENFPVKGTPQAYERWGKGFRKGIQEVIEWKGTPLKPEWIEQIKGQKKLAKEILGE